MPRYRSHYCEENIWHLLDAELGEMERAWAVFISNVDRRCMMWSQRAAPAPDTFVVWDYHVVAMAFDGTHHRIWDLDTTIETPSTAARWLEATFAYGFLAEFGPSFRVVERDAYLETFSSDRSHMRGPDGAWHAPPPDWDPIYDPERGMNLERFVDMSPATSDDGPGETMTAEQFQARFGRDD